MLKDKRYSVSMNKSQLQGPGYDKINNLIVDVTTNPILIEIPNIVQIPRDGCNLPFLIKLDQRPEQDLLIALQYDNILYPDTVFGIDQEFSDQILLFNYNLTQYYVSFCLTDKFPLLTTSLTIQVILGGTLCH